MSENSADLVTLLATIVAATQSDADNRRAVIRVAR
jgi:hypothetical protein